MKKLIILLFISVSACKEFAQTVKCPLIKVSSPAFEIPQNQTVSFIATGAGENSFTYNWSVSSGSITSGQGTSSITVNAKGLAGTSLTATAEVGGMDRDCPNVFSETVMIVKEPVKLKKKKP